MITQHYKLKANLDHLVNARPGQFVFENDESDDVIGFIDFVSDKEIAIMLFEPKVIDVPEAINISSQADWLHRLQEILNEDADIRELWDITISEYGAAW